MVGTNQSFMQKWQHYGGILQGTSIKQFWWHLWRQITICQSNAMAIFLVVNITCPSNTVAAFMAAKCINDSWEVLG